MEEILYLEPDEEITSVIDKIKQSKAHRIGLVVPREATLLQSVVNLRLLVKEATNLGKEIALITADKIGRNLASKVGLVVYESVKNQQPIYQPPPPVPSREEVIEIDDTQKETPKEIRPKGVQVHHFQEKKEMPRPRPISWQPSPKGTPLERKATRQIDWSKSRKIIWPMLAIVLILILIGLFLILPKVGVGLKVQAESFQKNIDSQISGNEPTSLENKTFSGQLIDLNREKEEKFPTTGKKNLGGKATGTLTLYNYWDSSTQSINAGAKFSSSSKTFVAKTSVSIPGTSIRGGNIVPGTANVEIEAENPGEEYNVKAGRFTIVGMPSDQQEKIYGQSSKDLSGGFSKEVQVVSQADYDQAKTKITQELNEELKKELQDKSAGLEILENTLQIDIVEETTSAKVDSEAQEFSLKIKERLREIVFQRMAFDDFILSILEKQIPSTQMITLGPNDTISPQIKEKKYDTGLLTFDVKISAKISTRIDTEKVKDNLLGKSRQDAENYLNNLEGLNGFEIIYFPSWWPVKRMPNYKRNLNLSLDYLAPETNPSPSPLVSPQPSPEATQ